MLFYQNGGRTVRIRTCSGLQIIRPCSPLTRCSGMRRLLLRGMRRLLLRGMRRPLLRGMCRLLLRGIRRPLLPGMRRLLLRGMSADIRPPCRLLFCGMRSVVMTYQVNLTLGV